MPLDLGSGVILEATSVGSGTGNYDSFLRVQSNGDQEGYNTDVSGQLDNKDGIWTHSILLSGMAIINVNGIDYYEIRLDLNEVQSGNKAQITLTDLEIYYGAAAGAGADFSGLTQVFDLSGSQLLIDSNSGSGTDDYRFLLPVSLFPDPTQYFTLYAAFDGSDDGFEEFRVQTIDAVDQPSIGVNKQTNGSDDECPAVLTGTDVTWTYTVTNDGNIPLTNVQLWDDNGTPLDTSDDFQPTYVSGDTNGDSILDLTETWIYTYTLPAVAGEYENIATVSGDWAVGETTGTSTAEEEDCYFGVNPAIELTKQTNGTDDECPVILMGSDVVWTYQVSNTGNVVIEDLVVWDDNGTPLDTSDDFQANYVGGDTNGNGDLDLDETWTFSYTGTAGIGEYSNLATASGSWTYGELSGDVESEEDDCYFGADPSLEVQKLTNGTDDLCPVLSVGEDVTWTYFVTNTGNVALDFVLTDDNGTPGDDSDDFNPDAVLSGGYNAGDSDMDGVFDPGEIWQYIASGTVIEGPYENTATAVSEFTDAFQNSTPVTGSDSDCYVGLDGCVRTPGFWQNPRNGGQFWDGVLNNEKHRGQDGFPPGELLYAVDSNNDGYINAVAGDGINDDKPLDQKGLLIGDYNHDGLSVGEDTIFISYNDARTLINANNKQMSDGVIKIGRDVVATWLNYLAGSAIGEESDTNSPRHFIDDAIDFLQIFGDSDNSNATGNGNTNDMFDTYFANHRRVDTSSVFWQGNFPGGDHSGSNIHGALDGYNNTGAINGIAYSASCDNPQFVGLLDGYSIQGSIISMM